MRKAIIAVITASALFAIGAFASNLGVSSDNLASGQDGVTQCGDASVEWVTDAVVGSSGDWTVTSATVSFLNDTCDGAKVDLAVGRAPGGTGTTVSGWDNFECGTVDPSNNAVKCTPSSGAPPVNEIIQVAVLANGNSVNATVLP